MKEVQWMLRGIFLFAMAIWCLLLDGVVFKVLGAYVLPLGAVLCLFAGGGRSGKNKEASSEEEKKE